MTIAVDWDVKQQNKQNQQNSSIILQITVGQTPS